MHRKHSAFKHARILNTSKTKWQVLLDVQHTIMMTPIDVSRPGASLPSLFLGLVTILSFAITLNCKI